MIIDSCYAASAMGQDEVFPGPSKDRGFGQLALNKKMRILAGSQKAQESPLFDKIPASLIVYSLVNWGIDQKGADFRPQDGKITFSEWLAYAVEAVPELWTRVVYGGPLGQPYPKLWRPRGVDTKDLRPEQRPSLFDSASPQLDLDLIQTQVR